MYLVVASLFLWMGNLCGEIAMIDSPDKITSEWEEKVLGIKYGVTTLDKAVDEMIQGLISEIFDEAFIQKIAETIKQQPTGEGEFVEYWGNGTLKAKLPFKDGKAHGHLHGWHDDGNDAFKGYFCEGVKQGVHMTFYKPEEKKGIYKARLLIYNNEGKLDGDQRKNHKDGRLGLSVEYEKGILRGALEAWDITGKQYLSVAYKKGVKQKNPPPPNGKRKRIERPDERYVSEVINEFAKAAVKEFDLEVCGSGAGMPFDVESIIIKLWKCKKSTIEDARELIVRLTERFTGIINKHEKLRPYLREYPFTPYRTDIFLRFCDKKGISYEEGSAYCVAIDINKQVSYSTVSKEDSGSIIALREPYEKAVEIVRAKESERALLEKIKKQ